MTQAKDGIRLTPSDMRKHISVADRENYHIGLLRGELHVGFYIPQGRDMQKPHTRDECYVVVRGSGKFQLGDEIVPFEAGDFLFVPAGMEHRFLEFGESLETWVIFYGPEGGARVK